MRYSVEHHIPVLENRIRFGDRRSSLFVGSREISVKGAALYHPAEIMDGVADGLCQCGAECFDAPLAAGGH